MHVVAVGGSDAGIAAALRARELDPGCEVTVIVADAYPNFSICGIPYYVAGDVAHWSNLAHRSIADLEATGMRLLHAAARLAVGRGAGCRPGLGVRIRSPPRIAAVEAQEIARGSGGLVLTLPAERPCPRGAAHQMICAPGDLPRIFHDDLNPQVRRCPEWDSNPHWIGFEPNASAGWAIGAVLRRIVPVVSTTRPAAVGTRALATTPTRLCP